MQTEVLNVLWPFIIYLRIYVDMTSTFAGTTTVNKESPYVQLSSWSHEWTVSCSLYTSVINLYGTEDND